MAQPDTILVLSPGLGTPDEAGNMIPLIKRLIRKVPMLGICLEHQSLIEAFSGKVVQAGEILHGKISRIEHDNEAMFKGLTNPMPVACYHSLMGINLPDELISNASYNSISMAIRHRTLPICSFQFHPESILTVQGAQF